MVQAQFGGQSTEIANLRQEIAQLRLELSTLRDTSTQYDMSIQSNIDEIQHRLTTVETRARAAQSEPQLTRTVGRTE
jgi:TolA-binding protein